MYLEFLYIIVDYFSTLDRKIVIYEWLIPMLLGIGAWVGSYFFNVNLYNIIQEAIPIVVTLLGFTLATLTLFLTGNSKVEQAKKYITAKTIQGKKISLYRFLVITYSYLIILEAILCIGYYIAKLFPFIDNYYVCTTINAVFIILVINLFFSTIRSITDLYFIITREDKK